MKRILKITGILILIILVLGVITYFIFPETLIEFSNSQNAKAAQLEKKTIDIDGYDVSYFISKKNDKAETLVLLHGMGDDKNSFVLSAKTLANDYNLVLPDLSGHGENLRDLKRDYSIDGQVEFVHSFLEKLNVKSSHLAGNSMGGHTAAAYAIKYPEQVKSLILINAPGIKIDDHVVYGGFGAPLESKEDLIKILDRVFVKPPEIPAPIAKAIIKQVNGSIDFVNNTLVLSIVNGKDFNLKDKVNRIQSPTLILWGKHDEVVKFNVAQYYNDHIPISEIQLLEKGAHSPQLEIPEDVANAIHTFIQKPKTTMIHSTKNNHAAKVQYYRWYQFYERNIENKQRLANQLEILDKDVRMKSAAGEMNGRANYPERLTAYKGWKNAHHVKNITVNKTDNGLLNLEADIVYQNIKPDNSKSSYSLHYSTFLKDSDGLLPVFTDLTIQPTGTIDSPTFEDAYPTNRAKSLMYYWLVNMEQLDGNVIPFKELLAKDFTLNFSTSSKITSINQLETWLNGTPKQLKLSNHYPESFSIKTILENEYEMTVEFDWKGITKDGKTMKARTKHIWYIIDNPNDRFAKILRADVSQIEPLQVISK